MNVTVAKLPKSAVKLSIELSVEEMQSSLQKAAEELSREHKIEGFRPGKASLGIVVQRLGAQAVWEHAAEHAVRKFYVQAVKEQELQTVGAPKISVHKLAPDNPFSFHAEVALLPEMTLGKYQQLSVPRKTESVQPEKVDQALADLQQMFAKEAAADRPARQGDKVEVDFVLSVDGQAIEGGRSTNHPVVIGSGQFIPGFEDQLVGLKSGDHKEFDLTFPQDYHNQAVAGKAGHFAVDVKTVLQIDKPELNDDFAKQASKHQTLAELRKQIEKNLQEEAEHKADREHERAIIEALIQQSKFSDLPEVLIENELSKMLHELRDEIEQRGMKFDDYLQNIKKNDQSLRQEFRPQAEKRVKSALVLRAIAKQEQVEVSDTEVQAEIQQALKTYAQYPELKTQIESEDYRDFAKLMLTNRKVVAKLKEWAQPRTE